MRRLGRLPEPMKRSVLCLRLALILLLISLAGCGGDKTTATKPEPAANAASLVAQRVSTWSSAATSYNGLLQNCARQPTPARGYMAACTRLWRKRYIRATARLTRTRPSQGSPPSCSRAFLEVHPIIEKVTRALRLALRANSESLESESYHGPSVLEASARADSITRRETKRVDRLATTIRRSCAAPSQ